MAESHVIEESVFERKAFGNHEHRKHDVSLLVVTVQLDEARVCGYAKGLANAITRMKTQMLIAVYQQPDRSLT